MQGVGNMNIKTIYITIILLFNLIKPPGKSMDTKKKKEEVINNILLLIGLITLLILICSILINTGCLDSTNYYYRIKFL